MPPRDCQSLGQATCPARPRYQGFFTLSVSSAILEPAMAFRAPAFLVPDLKSSSSLTNIALFQKLVEQSELELRDVHWDAPSQVQLRVSVCECIRLCVLQPGNQLPA